MKLSIFHKILITMLIVAVIPLIAIWYRNYLDSTQYLNESVEQQLSGTSARLVLAVDDWVTTNHKLLNQNGSLPEMASMNARLQTPFLKSILKEYAWSFLVFTVRPDGTNIARSDDKEPIFYGDRVYFKQVMDGAPLGKQVLISRTTGKPTLVLAAPIRSADNQTVGVLAISTSIADLSEMITKSKIGTTGYAFLLDEDGKVVAHHKQEFVNTSADFSKHPAFLGRANETARKLTFEENGKEVIAYSQKTQHGWTMVVQQDRDDAFRPITDANRRALMLLAATLVAVTLMAFLLARRLSGPIRNLTLIADEISRGRLDIKIQEVSRHDEIGALAAAIERMGVSIRMSLQKLRARA